MARISPWSLLQLLSLFCLGLSAELHELESSAHSNSQVDKTFPSGIGTKRRDVVLESGRELHTLVVEETNVFAVSLPVGVGANKEVTIELRRACLSPVASVS